MRTRIDYFKEEGFSVVGDEETPNKLMEFIKEHFPQIIQDNEVKLDELKAVLGLPIDEKVNGYGLNFIGRNVARSKYAAPTDKELKVNHKLSKNFDTTQNLVLKGDNLDTLKILKSYYSGKIKCIYIDPPYNTTSDEFIYPDKFDKEEAEVLGLANLNQEDMDRLEFSFGTKKSHNGWLSFMYPRLVLARDLLTEDGVIFMSIDDNEQANLKLLCDEIFGEENFVANLIWKKKQGGGNDSNNVVVEHEYVLAFSKNLTKLSLNLDVKHQLDDKLYPFEDNKGNYGLVTLDKSSIRFSDSLVFEIEDKKGNKYLPRIIKGKQSCWRWSKSKVEKDFNELVFKNGKVYTKYYRPKGVTPKSLLISTVYGRTETGSDDIKNIFQNQKPFDYPKPLSLITHLNSIGSNADSSDIILDFFAGSGTTGHAVMQLNSEDDGNRKFILCQIDEPIAENKPAYQFCKDHNLEPVISSITIERLRRAGEKIKAEIEEENKKAGLFKEDQKQIPDIGFKVFDTVSAPELELIDEKFAFPKTDSDTLSRIYNMIFSVGIDDPTSPIETVVEDSIYKIGNHYYITNSEKISKEDLAKAIANGKVFIDGWTASINASLQHYKEEVEIVF